MAAATALASLFFVRLIASRYLTPAHQLRRYLLQVPRLDAARAGSVLVGA